MATRQYENFKSPILDGRYNRGRVDAQRLANDKAVLGNINTPFGAGYQIGSAIGNAIADNYNERGIGKARASMGGYFNDFLNQQGGQQQPQTEQQGVLGNSVRDRAMPNMASQLSDGSVPTADQLTSNLADGNIGGVLNNMGIGIPDPRTQRSEYLNGLWLNKYDNGATDNPDGDKVKIQNDIKAMNSMGNNIDFGKINKDDAREFVRQKLEQDGRTPYQIEEAMRGFDSMYDSKFNKWNEDKATDYLNKGLNALKGDKPNYDDAFRNLAASAARGNKEAQMQLRRLDYMQNKQDKLDAEERAFQRQLYLKDNYGKGARGGSSSGGSASSGGVVGVVDGSPYTLDMYKADLDAIKNLDPEDPVAKAAHANILQLRFGIKFRPQGQESTSAPSGKNAPKETYGFNVTNQDDDNRDSAEPGIFARLGNMIGGLVPEASDRPTGWAAGDFGPSIAERALGYDPRKVNR